MIADHRETASNVVREIYRLDCEVETRQLDVGDFVISQRVGIERKTVSDFLQSLVDGRLLDQTKNLAENFERPILILEGKGLYTERGIHPNAIRGALACIVLDFGVSLVPTENEKDTAKMITSIARREQKEEEKKIPVRSDRKALTLSDMQRYIVEGLPGVSAVLAERLLDYFGRVERIMSSSMKELQEVEGIGEGKAREIRKVLTSEFTPDE